MFALSPSHPMPLYAQLTRAIQFAITTGRLRVGEQFVTPLILGVLIWGGLFLRDPRLRALIPFRSQ